MRPEHTVIPFNKPLFTGRERTYIDVALAAKKLAGAGAFSTRCQDWIDKLMPGSRSFVTTSATHALEMAALMCDLLPGDEVIVPSYAFPTTASAFVRCGARIAFVDIDPNTMNIDPDAVVAAISERTKAIVALHYGGVACDMSALCAIAAERGLVLIEDAAQALGARFQERPCGSIGTFGCFSFHESKNIHCGEGGALICNESGYAERAEIIMEKGTNRSQFFRGEVDKYTWRDVGSSYVLSELNAAFLFAQLEALETVTEDRRRSWYEYAQRLEVLAAQGYIELATPPQVCFHNAHMFWIKVRNSSIRSDLIGFLRERGINSVFHYQPLHDSPAGKRFGYFVGDDRHTSRDAARLLRLPLYFDFHEAERVSTAVAAFFGVR
jgi:dTDP-4-amino-4,6-dideoxygalactose transaminase